jgi:restriction endonuclease S subunit
MWKTLSVSLFIIVNSEKIEEHQRQQDSLPMKKKKLKKTKKVYTKELKFSSQRIVVYIP